MSKINEKGFSLVEGLLALLIVLVLGFGGYYVWNQNKSEGNQSDISDSLEISEPGEIEAEEEDEPQYFEINKLNVRFEVDDSAPEIVITPRTSGDGYDDSAVYLGTKSFIDKVSKYYKENGISGENCAKTNMFLGVFDSLDEIRDFGLPYLKDLGDGALVKELSIKELNDGRYWYTSNQSQSVCYNPDPDLQFEVNKEIRKYTDLLETTL